MSLCVSGWLWQQVTSGGFCLWQPWSLSAERLSQLPTIFILLMSPMCWTPSCLVSSSFQATSSIYLGWFGVLISDTGVKENPYQQQAQDCCPAEQTHKHSLPDNRHPWGGSVQPSLFSPGRWGLLLVVVEMRHPLLLPAGTDDRTQSILNKPLGNCSSYLPAAFTSLIAWKTLWWWLETNVLACHSLAPHLFWTRFMEAHAPHFSNNSKALHLLHPALQYVFEVY